MDNKRLGKALDIMRLAEEAAARPGGISLAQIVETFGVTLRTAQRMSRALEEAFPMVQTFIFHPDQQVEDEADGSLTVRFTAGGWLEMAWHLYQWGAAVEVIAPHEVRELVEAHRRSDFSSLP